MPYSLHERAPFDVLCEVMETTRLWRVVENMRTTGEKCTKLLPADWVAEDLKDIRENEKEETSV